MDDTEDMRTRHARILGELSDLAMIVVRDLKDAVLTAEGSEAKAHLNLAFQRACCSVRHTLALEARLARGAVRAVREDQDEARKDHQRRTDQRKAQAHALLMDRIWTEHEASEAEPLEDTLSDLLKELAVLDDFLALPLDDLLHHLARKLGLNPPQTAPPSQPAFQSSA